MANLFERMKGMSRRALAIRAIVLVILGVMIYNAAIYGIAWVNKDRIYATGTIEAVETEVSTKVPGRVLSLMADEGDTLSKGAMIASLETSELFANFKQAVASERSAEIRYANAKKNYNRARSLVKRKMISDQDYDNARSNYEASESEMNRASAARAVAEISLNEATIRAPINGTILSKAVELGDLLAPYSTVVTMADLSNLEMMIYVSETKYGRIRLGDEVQVFVDSYANETFHGKVVFISDKAEFTPKNIQTKEERVSQVFGIKIDIPNQDFKLKPGMPADAIIFLN